MMAGPAGYGELGQYVLGSGRLRARQKALRTESQQPYQEHHEQNGRPLRVEQVVAERAEDPERQPPKEGAARVPYPAQYRRCNRGQPAAQPVLERRAAVVCSENRSSETGQRSRQGERQGLGTGRIATDQRSQLRILRNRAEQAARP